MNTDKSTEQEINEGALRALFSTGHKANDLAKPMLGKSDSDFLSGVKAGIERRSRRLRFLGMLPAFALTCMLAFLILPNVPLIFDALQVSLPESTSLLLADLGSSMEFKLGIVLLFGLGLPWLIDMLEQTSV